MSASVAGVSLIVPSMARWRERFPCGGPDRRKIVITAWLPPAVEPRNNLQYGDTQTPR
jgi:hypothetical protein